MTTIKLTINEKTGKGKHLLALIKEIAKSDDNIHIEKLKEPNRETIMAMNDTSAGRVTLVKTIDELFDSI